MESFIDPKLILHRPSKYGTFLGPDSSCLALMESIMGMWHVQNISWACPHMKLFMELAKKKLAHIDPLLENLVPYILAHDYGGNSPLKTLC
jgi:hypothetical protein